MSIRPVRQIVVTAKYGRLIHEIRLSSSEDRWQARVVTLPNNIWVEPGGKRALVFEAASADQAEEMAAAFIRRDSIARGHRVADPKQAGADAGPDREPARRRVGSYPVRFAMRRAAAPEGVDGQGGQGGPGGQDGRKRRARAASTENLSETGLFICTDAPLPPGSLLDLDVRLPGLSERLEGVVVWTRCSPGRSMDNGMGVRLLEPSLAYRALIQTLG